MHTGALLVSEAAASSHKQLGCFRVKRLRLDNVVQRQGLRSV